MTLHPSSLSFIHSFIRSATAEPPICFAKEHDLRVAVAVLRPSPREPPSSAAWCSWLLVFLSFLRHGWDAIGVLGALEALDAGSSDQQIGVVLI